MNRQKYIKEKGGGGAEARKMTTKIQEKMEDERRRERGEAKDHKDGRYTEERLRSEGEFYFPYEQRAGSIYLQNLLSDRSET